MRIGIVGLGAAGLRAAMALEKAGAWVELYEARTRIGGRLFSIDEGAGTLYEAGGEWIDADHHRVLGLMQHFGMEPVPSGDWPRKIVYGGKHTTEERLWSDALEDDLRVEAAARDLCAQLRLPPWENTDHAALDLKTLEDFFREHTRSERGLWWVTAQYRSDEGDDPEKIGLLGWLVGYLHYLDRDPDVMSAYRFPDGSRRFCERMLQTLKAEPQFDKVLRRVREEDGKVYLYFADGSTEEFDRVVLTLPPPALEQVVFDRPLATGKRCAVEACRMSPVVKLCWQFDRPWWEEEGWDGSMYCDGPLQQTWSAGLGEAPVLTAYLCGAEASRWIGEGDPVRAGLYELAKMFPQAPERFERGWCHNWVTDPYTKGAYSQLAPGYVLGYMQHIAPPEGRVHFAGEHTAEWTGFIEGALESGERVAVEILESLSVGG